MMNKGPWRITFDTNPDDCNLSCIMCEDHSPYSSTQSQRIQAGLKRRRMPIAIVKKIVAEAKKMGLKEIIPSTMGEPLLYKDFLELLSICREYDVKLNLTTNGTFPIRGVEEWANLLVGITSDIKISWNGATKKTQEKIMQGTNWDSVLSNVETFIKVRDQHAANGGNYCRTTFQLTFIEENVDELDSIVALAIRLGVDRVKGHHLWAHFDEIKELSMRRNVESIQRWNQAVQKARSISEKQKLPNGNFILLENIHPLPMPGEIKPSIADGICPFLGKEAWVAADGRFNPCCAPDKERLTLGDFGNLNTDTLNEIWSGESYRNLGEHYAEHSVCKKCNMRKLA